MFLLIRKGNLCLIELNPYSTFLINFGFLLFQRLINAVLGFELARLFYEHFV